MIGLVIFAVVLYIAFKYFGAIIKWVLILLAILFAYSVYNGGIKLGTGLYNSTIKSVQSQVGKNTNAAVNSTLEDYDVEAMSKRAERRLNAIGKSVTDSIDIHELAQNQIKY